MAKLTEFGLTELQQGLLSKQFSATELTEECIKEQNLAGKLNAFVTETYDLAIKMAQNSDARIAASTAGVLEGIPIAVKDLFCTKGVRTTAGSKILNNFIPTYESTITTKLWESGAVLFGKTNLDEFAMGSSNETSFFGPAENPWRSADGLGRVPGGSSGGSAVAVSSNIVSAAIGTDTGGSIRQPAAFTGIVGMKPTYGRCSRWGTIAFASSLDQAGPMTRSVKDAAIVMNCMAGFDPKDSTSLDLKLSNLSSSLTEGIKGLKVGLPIEYRLDGMDSEIETLWESGAEWLKSAGAEVFPVNLPMTKYALPAYYIIAPAEASSNLARYDGIRYGQRETGKDLIDMYELTRAEGFGNEVKRRILIGTYVLSAGYYDAYYLKAQKVRSKISEDFKNTFEKVDILLTPTAPSAAFKIGEKFQDPIDMYLNDIFTVPASMAGLPAISVPSGLSKNGLPLGLQIIAPAFGEEILFRAANVLEELANFTSKPDQWWKI